MIIKVNKIIVLYISILLLISCSKTKPLSKNFPYPFNNPINVSLLEQTINLGPAEIVKNIKVKDLKIMILDQKSNKYMRETLPKEMLQEFYVSNTEIKKYIQNHFNKGFLATTFPPGILKSMGDKTVIFLQKDATKSIIFHELLHYLENKSPKSGLYSYALERKSNHIELFTLARDKQKAAQAIARQVLPILQGKGSKNMDKFRNKNFKKQLLNLFESRLSSLIYEAESAHFKILEDIAIFKFLLKNRAYYKISQKETYDTNSLLRGVTDRLGKSLSKKEIFKLITDTIVAFKINILTWDGKEREAGNAFLNKYTKISKSILERLTKVAKDLMEKRSIFFKKGDINQDGKIDKNDYIVLQKVLKGNIMFSTNYEHYLADLNGDNVLTPQDAHRLKSILK